MVIKTDLNATATEKFYDYDKNEVFVCRTASQGGELAR